MNKSIISPHKAAFTMNNAVPTTNEEGDTVHQPIIQANEAVSLLH